MKTAIIDQLSASVPLSTRAWRASETALGASSSAIGLALAGGAMWMAGQAIPGMSSGATTLAGLAGVAAFIPAAVVGALAAAVAAPLALYGAYKGATNTDQEQNASAPLSQTLKRAAVGVAGMAAASALAGATVGALGGIALGGLAAVGSVGEAAAAAGLADAMPVAWIAAIGMGGAGAVAVAMAGAKWTKEAFTSTVQAAADATDRALGRPSEVYYKTDAFEDTLLGKLSSRRAEAAPAPEAAKAASPKA